MAIAATAPMLSRAVDVGELTLAYRAAGDRASPALVLLHGWPHSSALYEGVLEKLGASFRVLAFDLPAVGGSRGLPRSAEKMHLADVILTAAEKVGAHSILVAGVDVGGMIAFAAARDHSSRIRGAIVGHTVIPGIDPWSQVIADPRIWHFSLHRIPKLPETLVTGRERPYFDFFFNALAKEPRALDENLRRRLTEAYLRAESLHAGFEWYRAFPRDAERNAIHKAIDVPLLYLRGDGYGHIEDYAEGLRRAGAQRLESATIAGSGEYLPVEAPDAFVEQILRFRATVVG
jgi:pimeloyl-ACP methyl ester carboxylesterase